VVLEDSRREDHRGRHSRRSYRFSSSRVVLGEGGMHIVIGGKKDGREARWEVRRGEQEGFEASHRGVHGCLNLNMRRPKNLGV
jgi:hypothetical protein